MYITFKYHLNIVQILLKSFFYRRMMSKGFPHVPESILLEPDTDIIYTEQETYNYEQEKIENIGNNDDNEDDQENRTTSDPSVRGVLTKRLWNFILARSAIPADTKYVMILNHQRYYEQMLRCQFLCHFSYFYLHYLSRNRYYFTSSFFFHLLL